MMVEDRRGRGYAQLQAAAHDVITAGNESPGLVGLFSGYRADSPQFYAAIDRTKARMLDVPIENIFSTLQTQLGSSTSTTSISTAARSASSPRRTPGFAPTRRMWVNFARVPPRAHRCRWGAS